MTWCASASGTPMELVRPVVEEVNFRDMAVALSQSNRFNGCSAKPVSVAQHLIIGCEIAPAELRPWWLLHDGHEERGGDMTAPAKDAFRAIAYEMFGAHGAKVFETVRQEFERRHDLVIHQAAGLPLPTLAQRIDIKRIDLITLATEQRDFHAAQQRPWWINERGVQPHSRAYRPLPAAKAADRLYELFTEYLPALAGSSGRAA